MSALPPLRIIATEYDNYWHRQHFKGFDNGRYYCDVEGRLHTFSGEPECPLREDVEIVEVDAQCCFVKYWQQPQRNQ